MTVALATKKDALKQLRDAGKEFTDAFMSEYGSGAIILRSKEPGFCWKLSGQVAHATISEFAGPNVTEDDNAPLLLRMRMNLYPPPAIYYHLRSPKVRHKLGVSESTLVADDPHLELTAMPTEIGKFGKWLTQWLDNYFFQRVRAPEPPVQLISWEANPDLSERRDDICTVPNWHGRTYLWTPDAMTSWSSYLSNLEY